MNIHAHLGWPQVIYVTLLILADGYALAKNGEQRTGTYSFGWSVLGSAIAISLLYWGGFFA